MVKGDNKVLDEGKWICVMNVILLTIDDNRQTEGLKNDRVA